LSLFLISGILLQLFYPGGIAGYFSFKDAQGNIYYASISKKIPYILFAITFFITVVFTFMKGYSLIPVLGFLCCAYLLSESGETNWERFLIWLVIGMVLYFTYGHKHSKIGKRAVDES